MILAQLLLVVILLAILFPWVRRRVTNAGVIGLVALALFLLVVALAHVGVALSIPDQQPLAQQLPDRLAVGIDGFHVAPLHGAQPAKQFAIGLIDVHLFTQVCRQCYTAPLSQQAISAAQKYAEVKADFFTWLEQ